MHLIRPFLRRFIFYFISFLAKDPNPFSSLFLSGISREEGQLV
jgi:hypothetical protein